MGLKSSHSFYQKQQDPVYYITASSIVFFKKTRSFSVDVGGDSTINKVKFVPHNLLQQGTSCTHHPYGGRMEQYQRLPALPLGYFNNKWKHRQHLHTNLPTYISYTADAPVRSYNKENYKFTSGLGTWLYLYFIILFLHKWNIWGSSPFFIFTDAS